MELRLAVVDGELADLSEDIQILLDLEGELFDLSPACQRILLELETAIAHAQIATSRGQPATPAPAVLHAQAQPTP